jgi:hypothetical protein
VISADTLSDDVLLAIFDFCADEYQDTKYEIEEWQSLVHVCRRWRTIVFGSPRRLNLRLVCTENTRVRDTLEVWPPFPLVIQSSLSEGVGDIVAVLEQRDRVDRIYFSRADHSALETVLAAMLEPFPELTDLRVLSRDETLPVVPDSFLGGSAPRLRIFALSGIPFPGLPKLLLSTTHLVYLHLSNIPHSGYFSPDAMVTALSTLTGLRSLDLEFRSPRSHPDQESRRPPPLIRSALPVLTSFLFKGVFEYLDDFVARLDAPRLHDLSIAFFNDIIFDAPHFIQFISRTPMLKPLENAHVVFGYHAARVSFSQTSGFGSLEVRISCRELDWQVSSLEQVCTSCLPPLSSTEDLYIYSDPDSRPHWQDNIENPLWLELLHPFTALKSLHLSKECVPRIAPALQELVGNRTTEVLPTLQNILLEGLKPSEPVQEGIEKFVAARQLSGHSIAVSLWER